MKFNWIRYHDLVFKAIVGKLTPEERLELDRMKAVLKEGVGAK